MGTVSVGYMAGIWPLGFFVDGRRARDVLHNRIVAHVRAYVLISQSDDIDSDSEGIAKRVGLVHAMWKIEPAVPGFGGVFGDNSQAARNFDHILEIVDASAVFQQYNQ